MMFDFHHTSGFRLPGQSGDSTALRLIASSKLIRTTYKLSDSEENHNGGEAFATFAPDRKTSELFD
jgi:hypothetical protein